MNNVEPRLYTTVIREMIRYENDISNDWAQTKTRREYECVMHYGKEINND